MGEPSDDDSFDDDPLDGGLFISADGINQSVPWRLEDYGWGGPLYSEQIEALSERFGFDKRSLSKLSDCLGRALQRGAPNHLVYAPISVGAVRAAKAVTKARKAIDAIFEKLIDACGHLAPLHPNNRWNPEGAAHFVRARKMLKKSERCLEEAEHALQDAVRSGPFAYVLAPADKKTIKDKRRHHVLKV